jgi:hypothetical protein
MAEDEIFRIKYLVDDADAKAKLDASGRAYDTITSKAVASAKKVGAVQKEAAQAQFVSIGKVQMSGVKLSDRLQAEAKKTADKQIAEAKRAADAQVKAADKAAKAQWSVANAIQGISAASVAMKGATLVFDYFVTKFATMRTEIGLNIASLEDYRKVVLQLAALKDKLGGTTTETKENLLFRAETLQSRQTATQFQEAVVGAGESAVKDAQGKGLISREEFNKLMMMAGKFQAAEGGAAETHGTLAGMLPMLMGKQDVTAKEAFQKEQQLYAILKPGGATFTSGMSQLLKQSPLITSGLYGQGPEGVSKAASLLSAFTLSNKEGGGENLAQFTRATVGGLGKMKGVKLEGDSEKIGEYLTGIKATNQMDPIQIGKLISADMAREEREQKTQGKTANLYDYLKYKGYGNQEELMSLLQFHGLQKTGQFENVFEPLATTLPDMDKAEMDIKKFQRTDPLAKAMKRDVGTDLASVSKSVGAPESYENAKIIAYDTLRAAGKTYDTKGGGKEGLAEWEAGHWGWFDTSRKMIADKANQMLMDEAKKYGIKAPTKTVRGGGEVREISEMDYSVFESEETRANRYYKMQQLVGQAGGNPNVGINQLVAIAKKQLETAEKAEAIMRGGQQAPIPIVAPGGKNAGPRR